MRLIDADALIADMHERYCKPCKDKGEDYHEVRCRACWVDDAIDDVDGFADNSIDIVFCKECKYWRNTDAEKIPTASIACGNMHADDFCSYGEVRDE